MKIKLISLGLIFQITSCTYNNAGTTRFESSLVFQEKEYKLFTNQDSDIPPTGIPKGTVTCSSSPQLPDGLVLSAGCRIKGRPVSESPLQKYLIEAHTNQGSQIFEIWILVETNSDFSEFYYPQASYRFSAPREIETITPSYSAGKPTSCISFPNLPVTLKLNSDCSIQGLVTQAYPRKSYLIAAVAEEKIFYQSIEIEAIVPGMVSDLLWFFDANLPIVTQENARLCKPTDSATWLWDNLALNTITSAVLEPFEEYPIRTPCSGNTSGWYGDGTPVNPFRWRSDGDVVFIDQNFEAFTDFTLSFWARAMSDNVSFISSYENDSYYDRSDSNFAADSYELLFDVFSSVKPPTGWTNGLTFPGVFIYDNYGNYDANNRSNEATLMKATAWNAPLETWHHFTIAQNFDSKILKFYIDGIEVSSTTLAYKSLIYDTDAGTHALQDRKNYILGGKGVSEFAQVKLFKKMLTPSEILSECEMGQENLSGASCSNDVKSYFVDFHSLPVGSCSRYDFKLTNLLGQALPVGRDLIFDVEVPAGISISENSDCSNPKSYFSYTATQTSKNFYMSATQKGKFPFKIIPRNLSTPRSSQITVTNAAHHVHTPFDVSTCLQSSVSLYIRDSSGQPAVLGADTTGSIVFTPSVGLATSYPLAVKRGESEITFTFTNPNLEAGTMTVSIPGVPIDGTNTYSNLSCD
tara:strand:- start:29539 stop:31617 length:2079 start_codon:yes stop_codon:yes gene_type:complete